MDLFEERNLAPMLIAERTEPFADPEYLYEMKWDGERCVAYLDPDGGTDLRNKRSIRLLPRVPELSQLHKSVSCRCILDGELLCMEGGKPSFETIQRRSLLQNPFQIETESRRHPATFVAFDCIYRDGLDLTREPLIRRREALSEVVQESERLAVSRYCGADMAMGLFDLVQQMGLEGVVAKRKDSLYYPGKRTRNWKKIKNLQDEDFVICGYYRSESEGMTGLVLGQYDARHHLCCRAHVTLGVTRSVLARVRALPRSVSAPFPVSDSGKTTWVVPVLVCTVTYMYRTQRGTFRQPVLKGLREDKLPEECVMDDDSPGDGGDK